MDHWLQDLRYAVRMLRKKLTLSLVIVASLALGIGANSAVFSVVDALLLRPLPYPHADRLAAVWLHSPAIGILRDWPSPGQYIDIQNQNHSFEQMALAQSRTFTLTGRDQPQRVDVLRTQSGLLTMLGARALLGRTLLPEEDRPGKQPVAILGDRAWQRLFNANPAIIGRSITLDGVPYVVAGVLSPAFTIDAEVMPSEGPMDKVDIFLPLPLGPMPRNAEATKITILSCASNLVYPCPRRKPTSTQSPAASGRKTSVTLALAWMSSACRSRLSGMYDALYSCCWVPSRLSC
jgi:hypothetical protein